METINPWTPQELQWSQNMDANDIMVELVNEFGISPNTPNFDLCRLFSIFVHNVENADVNEWVPVPKQYAKMIVDRWLHDNDRAGPDVVIDNDTQEVHTVNSTIVNHKNPNMVMMHYQTWYQRLRSILKIDKSMNTIH